MLPEDWKQQLDGYDAIYFGAVGESRQHHSYMGILMNR